MTSSIPPESPENLARKGRPADQIFQPEEELYYRVSRLDNGEVPPQLISIPDQSTNRSRYGPAEWLLILASEEHKTDAVAAICVGDVPKELFGPLPDKVKHSFEVVHDPLEDNFPHTEIRCFKNNIRIEYENRKKIQHQVKQEYRIQISKKSTIKIPPKNSMPSQ